MNVMVAKGLCAACSLAHPAGVLLILQTESFLTAGKTMTITQNPIFYSSCMGNNGQILFSKLIELQQNLSPSLSQSNPM